MFISQVYAPIMAGDPSHVHNSSLTNNLNALEGTSADFDDGLILNSVRSRKKNIELPCCPVCSCTLRPSELQSHFSLEMDKLSKITSVISKRKSSSISPGAMVGCSSSNGSGGEEIDVTGNTGSEVYERVRRNRERRLRAGRSTRGSVQCPICNRHLHTAEAEVHVDNCLRKSMGEQGNDDDDESIDVEGDTAEETGFGTTYEWCSQVRVRTAELHLRAGGDLPHGGMLVRRASTDTHVVVDGDEDVMLYGPPQYSPERLMLQEDGEVDATAESDMLGFSSYPEPFSTEDTSNLNGSADGNSKIDTPADAKQVVCYEMVVDALKTRIRELEIRLGGKNQKSETKCLICMGPYENPLVSFQCWHVHCETCWLQSLKAKKTCPQCNTITTTTYLRRIYI